VRSAKRWLRTEQSESWTFQVITCYLQLVILKKTSVLFKMPILSNYTNKIYTFFKKYSLKISRKRTISLKRWALLSILSVTKQFTWHDKHAVADPKIFSLSCKINNVFSFCFRFSGSNLFDHDAKYIAMLLEVRVV